MKLSTDGIVVLKNAFPSDAVERFLQAYRSIRVLFKQQATPNSHNTHGPPMLSVRIVITQI
jgi:hypothetical protein